MSHRQRLPARDTDGFTLIEISIVLVIIGLIAGGILVARDLIEAATVRKQISDLEDFNTSVTTFRLKYNAIPGDVTPAQALQFGLQSRVGSYGCGDGNTIISSLFHADAGSRITNTQLNSYTPCRNLGGDESQLFWQDLQTSGLLTRPVVNGDASALPVESMLPVSRFGRSFIVAANGNMVPLGLNPHGPFGYIFVNYPRGRSQIDGFQNAPNEISPGLTVSQAYSIDTKVDDGDPLNGSAYTMNRLPFIQAPTHQRGTFVGCSLNAGGGRGAYDLSSTTSTGCVLKVLGTK